MEYVLQSVCIEMCIKIGVRKYSKHFDKFTKVDTVFRFPIPEREKIRNHGDVIAPYRTPALIGCGIAIDREFFFEIGSFDKRLNIWGGENSELSLRVWQCGGAMEIVPCSRVGHYFRLLPYSFNAQKKEDVKIRNHMRVATLWMDEYKPYFDVMTPRKPNSI